jgi:ADP-ribose pyrophosphatase YjhB (NUDIX family)
MSPHLRRLRAALGSELLLLPSVTGIVFDDQNRILLVRQGADGVWSAPGGAMEPGESPADAVVREVWEETGFYTEPVRLLGVYGGPECEVAYPNGDRTAYVMSVFECAVRGGTLAQASDETSAAAFVSAADLPAYRTSPWVLHVLPGLYQRTRTAHFEAPRWTPPDGAPSAVGAI